MKFTNAFTIACMSAGFLNGALAAAPKKAMVTIGKYEGTSLEKPEGAVEITQGDDGKLLMTGEVKGLEACADDKCGIHIHSGHNCDGSSGGHYYYGVKTEEEPWLVTKYTADADGVAKIDVEAKDVKLERVFGRTVVLHDGEGNRVACGVIQPEGLGTTVLGAQVKPYQDAKADTAVGIIAVDDKKISLTATKKDEGVEILLATEVEGKLTGEVIEGVCPEELEAVEGSLEITQGEALAVEGKTFDDLANNAFKVTIGTGEAAKSYCTRLTNKNTVSGYVYFYENEDKLNFVGHANGMELSPEEVVAGWHVHTGKTCATNEVGGHLMKGEGDAETDPWKDLKYTVTKSGVDNEDKEDGRTYFEGSVEGVDLEFISDRTVVLHAENGAVRSGCGELNVFKGETGAASSVNLGLSAMFFAAAARFFA